MIRFILIPAFFLVSCGLPGGVRSPAPAVRSWRGPQVWQNDINAFIARDKVGPPPEGAVLFMGSSSTRMWDLKKYFPGLPVINRGFGGSYISDSANYTDSIAAPYKPRVVVLYAGDNDIADGKPPKLVASDFGYFLSSLRVKLPRAPVVYIAIKPSPARWELWPVMREANGLIKRSCELRQPCRFVDASSSMLGRSQRPS